MSIVEEKVQKNLILPENLSEKEQEMAFKQYEILISSLGNMNEIRENSSNLWTTVNGVAISAIAYLKEAENLPTDHKKVLLWTLISIGTILCISWISYLLSLKKEIEVRNRLLLEIEFYFPIALFRKINLLRNTKSGLSILTLKEMIVPVLFLVGYTFFAIMLFFFTQEVVECVK